MAIWSRLLKRTDMAIEYWNRVAALRPKDASVPASIAFLEAERGQPARAIEQLQLALTLQPEDASQWYNLAYLQQQQEQHEEALKSFDAALKLNEKMDLAWYGRGISLVKLGRVDEAIVSFKKNTVLQPLSPFGFYQLAHAYLRQGDLARVKRTIVQVSAFEPKVALQLQKETGIDAGIKPPFQ
jgi:tetratricopeptide (TPR) repeat protein